MLYHGSKTYIEDCLEPRVSFELEKWVYATDDYFYALLRCGNFDITKSLAREEHEWGRHSLCEVVPGAFEELFDRPGYIYEVDESLFTKLRDGEYVADKEVPIVRCIHIENIWKELQRYPDVYELISYEDSEPYWEKVRGGKEGYLERRRNSVNKIKALIDI